jgi:hypothetical protein
MIATAGVVVVFVFPYNLFTFKVNTNILKLTLTYIRMGFDIKDAPNLSPRI